MLSSRFGKSRPVFFFCLFVFPSIQALTSSRKVAETLKSSTVVNVSAPSVRYRSQKNTLAFCTCVEPVFLSSKGVFSQPFHPKKPAICVIKVLLVSTGGKPLERLLDSLPDRSDREQKSANAALERKPGQQRGCFPERNLRRNLKSGVKPRLNVCLTGENRSAINLLKSAREENVHQCFILMNA